MELQIQNTNRREKECSIVLPEIRFSEFYLHLNSNSKLRPTPTSSLKRPRYLRHNRLLTGLPVWKKKPSHKLLQMTDILYIHALLSAVILRKIISRKC